MCGPSLPLTEGPETIFFDGAQAAGRLNARSPRGPAGTFRSAHSMAQARAPRPSGLGWLRRHMDQWAFNRPAACAPDQVKKIRPLRQAQARPTHRSVALRFASRSPELGVASLKGKTTKPILLDSVGRTLYYWRDATCVHEFFLHTNFLYTRAFFSFVHIFKKPVIQGPPDPTLMARVVGPCIPDPLFFRTLYCWRE